MKQLVAESVLAVAPSINRRHRDRSFELFGYDMMVSEDLSDVVLIEGVPASTEHVRSSGCALTTVSVSRAAVDAVNSNPCLDLVTPHLAAMIPAMLEHLFQLTVDVFFPHLASPASTPAPDNGFEELLRIPPAADVDTAAGAGAGTDAAQRLLCPQPT